MAATYDLFQRWMKAKGLTSERQAAKTLGLSAAAITPWKDGRQASIEVIERMCRDLGEDYVLVVMQAFAETAPTEPARKLWRKAAKRLGGVLAMALALHLPSPTASAARPMTAASDVYIMRS